MGFLRIRKNTFISLAIFGIVFLVIIVSQYKMGSSYVDSDMAAEMVLAEQLNDEGVLLSNDWYYSTEIRIIGEPTLLALTERIFPNDWHSARVLAKAITMLVFSATFVYLSRVLGVGNYGVLGAAVLISPFGFWHAFHSVFGPFYMTHMIYVNVILALIIDIANRINVKKILYYLLGIVAFIAGLGGVRILLMLIVPEMMTVGVMYLMKAQKEKRLSFDNDRWINRLIKSSLVAFASSVVGYVVNSKVIYKLYSIVNINQTWKDFSLSSFLEALSWFLELFGYPVNDFFDEPISIMSLKGVIFGGVD